MHQWEQHYRRAFETAILNQEAPRNPEMICSCGEKAIWRCVDCVGAEELCAKCCCKEHTHIPWHRVEVWNNMGFFDKSWLRRVGLRLCCGHSGLPCTSSNTHPEDIASAQMFDDTWEEVDTTEAPLDDWSDANVELANTLQPSRTETTHETQSTSASDGILTVVDITGIHDIPVLFCKCSAAPENYLQLLSLKLYPASCKRPSTVFTFAVLADFLLHNRVAHTPAASYFSVIQRKTDSVQPHHTPVSDIPCD